MTLRLTTLPLWFVVAACAGGARTGPAPRAGSGPGTSPEAVAEQRLVTAEARVRRHPRNRAAWRTLQRTARIAGQPHRYLLALEATEARGRLPSGLRAVLARGLRRRAENLARLPAPSAALRALTRADGLAPAPASRRGLLAALRDRLALRQADRWLRADDTDRARKVYDDLAKRAVLDGPELHWRRAAVGQTRTRSAMAAALLRLGDEAPGPGQRLAREYLEGGGRDPMILLTALRTATLGSDASLITRLDQGLSAVAPRPVLAAACRLRRRPTSPCCRQLQRWATLHLGALRHWAGLCRALHWIPGDVAWLKKIAELLRLRGALGLGPLEDLVPVALARKAAAAAPGHLALLRLAGQRSAHRKALAAATTTSRWTLEQRALEAWAAGLPRQATSLLAQATTTLTAKPLPTPGFEARCRLVRLTRRLQGGVASWRLLRRLTQQDPQYRKHLLDRLLAQGRPAAAMALAKAGEQAPAVRWLRRLGQTLGRWGVSGDRSLRKHWEQRYGAGPAQRAWAEVTAGARSAKQGPTPDLRELLRLAGQGQLAKAARAARQRVRAAGARSPGRPTPSPRFWTWWAWLAQVTGDKPAAKRRLRQLRHLDPGGLIHLPAVMRTLARLGYKGDAGRLADGLYERAPSDPALLRLVTLGAITAGRTDKAELAITEWASQTGRPDQVYLTAAAWTASAGHHHRAAALASKGLGWTGHRPLEAALATLRHQWAARRQAEARRTEAWLLARWPAGTGRQGISHTLALTLPTAARRLGARPGKKRARKSHQLPPVRSSPGEISGLAPDLSTLLRKGRLGEVRRIAAARAAHQPLVARWPALQALAAQSLRQWRVAASHVDHLARLHPEAAPLALALLHADQGHLRFAVTLLALAHTRRPDLRLLWLAAALAARAGKRPLAAQLASLAVVSATKAIAPTGPQLHRMTALARGQRLPLEIPWAMLLATPNGAGSCDP